MARRRRNAKDKELERRRFQEVYKWRIYERRFGLTKTEFENLLKSQAGRCAICGDVPEKALHLDHNHQTNKIRGLLCSKCNTALGLLNDNPDTVEAAAVYLRRNS